MPDEHNHMRASFLEREEKKKRERERERERERWKGGIVAWIARRGGGIGNR